MMTETKKKGRKGLRIFLLVLILLAAAAAAAAGYLRYRTDYRTREVAEASSDDGTYTVRFLEVGEAGFAFGSNHGRLVLMQGKKKIAKADFEVFNDGKTLGAENFSAEFAEDGVTAVIIGEEQDPATYILYYNGETLP